MALQASLPSDFTPETLHVLRDYESHKILCDIQLSEAGRGGFGKVIVGKDKFRGFVAIKYFPVNGGEPEQRAIRKMVHREYDMLLRSHHKNIADVFGLTKWRGAMGIVMEYYEAGNLRVLLLSNYIPLGWSLRLRLAHEITDGVSYIHNCGKEKRLIHADMKPENILLTAGLNVKIADFGCAMLASFTGSTTNQNPEEKPAMTLHYAAPEKLICSAPPKKEQDVFSCGVIFHMLIFRMDPYLSEYSKQEFRQMMEQGIRPNCEAIQELKNICSDNDRVIVELMERMMTRCWEQNPTQRPNMLDVRDEFQLHLATQDPAVISRQVADAVKEMEIKHPAAEHNPTVPLHQLNPATGEFYGESKQSPDVQPKENPSQSQNRRSASPEPSSSQLNITSPKSVETNVIESNQPSHVVQREEPSQHHGEMENVGKIKKRRKNPGPSQHQGEFVVVGGRDSERDCVKYDVTTKQHQHLPKLNKPRCWLTSAKVGDIIYAFGGSDKAAEKSCETLKLATHEQWEMLPDMLEARCDAASGVIGNNIYMTGGRNNDKLSSCEVYNANRNEWSRIHDMIKKRSSHGMCSVDNSLYCIGGADDKSCEHLDVRSGKWNSIPPMKHQETWGLSCVALNGKIYVTGGGGWPSSSHHECYDPAARKWSTLAALNTGRGYHGACVMNGKIYVVGGWDSELEDLRSVKVYDPTEDSWTHLFDLEKPVKGHIVVAL